jgi:hypothetical protein
VQKQLLKKKYSPADKLTTNLKAPSDKQTFEKTINKMRALTRCQNNMMKLVLNKIDRKSKHIKKQEKIVNQNLKSKRIFLEEENFDILKILENSIEHT